MEHKRLLITGCALALLFPLSGCDVDVDREGDADVEMEAEIDEEALEEVEQRTEEGLERAGETLEEAGREIAAGVERAAERVEPYVEDAAITAKVKARLTADPAVNPLTVDVDTVNGVVTLTGTVPTPSDRDLVLEHARSVEDVVEVRDNLVIGPRTGPNGT
jgi:osmotically-inducible protein OsmY